MEQAVKYDAHIANGDIQNDGLAEKTEKGVINAAFTATEEKGRSRGEHFSMINSAEHGILNAHKYKNIK